MQYTYDSLGRALTETLSRTAGGLPKTVAYAYSPDGKLGAMTYPSGSTVTMSRDSLRRLTAVNLAGGGNLATLSYTGSGRMAQKSFGNGTLTNYVWDGLGHLSALTHTSPVAPNFHDINYLRRDDGAILYEQRLHNGGSGDVYYYQSDGRLGAVQYGVANPALELTIPGSQPFASRTDYAFDATGNRTSVLVTPGGGGTPTLTAYTSNALNEYLTVGAATRAHDALGNLTTTPGSTYTYDFQNHLVATTTGGLLVGSYEHDALGRRISRATTSGTTRYVYAGADIVETYDAYDALTARFSYLSSPDGRFSYEAPDWADVNANGNTSEWLRFYYHEDARGSVVSVTDPAGAVAESYTYDVYGQPTIRDQLGQVVTTSPIRNPFLFTGREWDDESSLYH